MSETHSMVDAFPVGTKVWACDPETSDWHKGRVIAALSGDGILVKHRGGYCKAHYSVLYVVAR